MTLKKGILFTLVAVLLCLCTACGSLSQLQESLGNSNNGNSNSNSNNNEVEEDETSPELGQVSMTFTIDSDEIDTNEITTANLVDEDAEFLLDVTFSENYLDTIKLRIGLNDSFLPDYENYSIDYDDVEQLATNNFTLDLLAVDGVVDYLEAGDYYLWLWLVDSSENSSDTYESTFMVTE